VDDDTPRLQGTELTASWALQEGLALADRKGRRVLFRYLTQDDGIDEITHMLHAAYASLAAQGMQFVASWQDAAITRRRIALGETVVAVEHGEIVGIITLADIDRTAGSPFYDRDDVATLGQFAVRPAHQHRGIGSMLMTLVEQRAREKGVMAVALDTAEQARDLIEMYERRGYRFVEYAQWEQVNYRSVVLAKTLRSGRHAEPHCTDQR
jgi:GNAT superfamily N-acetyltransferase